MPRVAEATHDLMVAAILHASAAGQNAAARFFSVDPVDEADLGFYGAFGIHDIEGDAKGRTYLRIDDAVAALSESVDVSDEE